MPNLTTKQQNLLNFIKSVSTDGGKTAKVTLAVMADFMGIANTAGATSTINVLIAKGCLTREPLDAPGNGATYKILR